MKNQASFQKPVSQNMRVLIDDDDDDDDIYFHFWWSTEIAGANRAVSSNINYKNDFTQAYK